MAFLLDRNSKADTRGLFLAGSGLDVDVSQWRTNLSNHTTYHTSGDARLAPRSPREISVVVKIATSNNRIILNWGNVAGTSYMYRVSVATGGTGNVIFGHNGANLLTLTPPGVNGTAKSYLVHWSTDYDFFAGTYYSEMAICNIVSNTWEIARVTHSQPQAVAVGDQFNLLGIGAGSTLFTGGLAAVEAVRIGCRWHSVVEGSEDWVAENPPPDLTGIVPEVELAPSSSSFFSADPADDVADTLLDEETFAGPIEYSANINATAHRRRLYSPLLNISPGSPPLYNDSFFPSNMWRQVASSGLHDDLYFTVGHTYWRPTLKRALYGRVRVHAQTYLEAGAPGGSAVSVYLCMFAMASKPGKKVPAKTPGTASQIVHLTTDHSDTGTGQWYDLGTMFVSAKEGGTWLALGVGYGSGTGHSYIRLKVKAITVEPFDGS